MGVSDFVVTKVTSDFWCTSHLQWHTLYDQSVTPGPYFLDWKNNFEYWPGAWQYHIITIVKMLPRTLLAVLANDINQIILIIPFTTNHQIIPRVTSYHRLNNQYHLSTYVYRWFFATFNLLTNRVCMEKSSPVLSSRFNPV